MPRVLTLLTLLVILSLLTAVAASAQTPGCGSRSVEEYGDLSEFLSTRHQEQRAAFSLVSPGAVYEIWTGPAQDGRASYSVVLVMLVPTGKAACLLNFGYYPASPTHATVGI